MAVELKNLQIHDRLMHLTEKQESPLTCVSGLFLYKKFMSGYDLYRLPRKKVTRHLIAFLYGKTRALKDDYMRGGVEKGEP
jgi:hypothetical protein